MFTLSRPPSPCPCPPITTKVRAKYLIHSHHHQPPKTPPLQNASNQIWGKILSKLEINPLLHSGSLCTVVSRLHLKQNKITDLIFVKWNLRPQLPKKLRKKRIFATFANLQKSTKIHKIIWINVKLIKNYINHMKFCFVFWKKYINYINFALLSGEIRPSGIFSSWKISTLHDYQTWLYQHDKKLMFESSWYEWNSDRRWQDMVNKGCPSLPILQFFCIALFKKGGESNPCSKRTAELQ